MARVGVSITKSVPFRNGVQEFSNVYYYENGGALPSEAEALSLIDNITADEKTFHSTGVTFVRGRCWSQGGSPASNNMIAQKNLSGTGSTAFSSSFDKERAYLFRWRAGSDSRGNPVYLRKWYHSCGQMAGGPSTIPGDLLGQTVGFTTLQRDGMATQANLILAKTVGGQTYNLVAKSGRSPGANGAVAHAWLEHHQLGDMWRAQ